jgi:hypothetical protein
MPKRPAKNGTPPKSAKTRSQLLKQAIVRADERYGAVFRRLAK